MMTLSEIGNFLIILEPEIENSTWSLGRSRTLRSDLNFKKIHGLALHLDRGYVA